MSVENLASQEYLNNERFDYAAGMLLTHWLIQYVSFDTWLYDKDLPDFIEWKKDTDLGEGNVYVNEVLLGRYFKSEAEFLEACAGKKKGRRRMEDDFGPRIPDVRDFNNEDANQFSIDRGKYSVLKVFNDGSIALAGRNDTDGNFFLDVYPSRDLKKDILEGCIEGVQESINKKQVEISECQDRISNYRRQLEKLGTN